MAACGTVHGFAIRSNSRHARQVVELPTEIARNGSSGTPRPIGSGGFSWVATDKAVLPTMKPGQTYARVVQANPKELE